MLVTILHNRIKLPGMRRWCCHGRFFFFFFIFSSSLGVECHFLFGPGPCSVLVVVVVVVYCNGLIHRGGLELLGPSHLGRHEAPLGRIGTPTHGGHQRRGRDNAWHGVRGPFPVFFVPALVQHIEQQGTGHFGRVGRIKVGRKVIGGNAVAHQVQTVRTGHLLGSRTTLNVRQLRIEILRTLFSPRVQHPLGVRKIPVHVLDRLPTNLARQSDLERTLGPTSTERMKILVQLVVHKLQTPVGPLVGRQILVPLTTKTHHQIRWTNAIDTERFRQNRHVRDKDFSPGQRRHNRVDRFRCFGINLDNGNVDRVGSRHLVVLRRRDHHGRGLSVAAVMVVKVRVFVKAGRGRRMRTTLFTTTRSPTAAVGR